MSDQDDIIEAPQDAAEESGPDNFFIDTRVYWAQRKIFVTRMTLGAVPSWEFGKKTFYTRSIENE
jgi:hypothetical protein